MADRPSVGATRDPALDVEAIRDPAVAGHERKERACRAAYEHYNPGLRRYLWLRGGRELGDDDLDDVLGIVWAKAFNEPGLWTSGALEHRLARRARHAALNWIRAAARYRGARTRYGAELAREVGFADRDAAENDEEEHERRAAALERAIERLTPVDRRILHLSVELGQSARDVAAALGMTAGAVDVRKSRLRTRLREYMLAEGIGRW